MKDRLESFIEENKASFDAYSPSPNVWEKLNKKLEANEKKHWYSSGWLKIAAVVSVVILSTGIIVNSFFNSNDLRISKNADPEVRELIEAEAYYAQQVNGKMKEIRKCYRLIPELKTEVEDDLLELEGMYMELRNDLKENVANKEVIEAMIENNRYRMKLVDEVLEQVNC